MTPRLTSPGQANDAPMAELLLNELPRGARRPSSTWATAVGATRQAMAGQGHLWNYGLNTWGWEDFFGGGDRDYNDVLVQSDFTSAYGDRLLA